MTAEGADRADPAIGEVIDGELALLHPDVRADPEAVVRLLHDDFREFGASGRIWDRAGTVAALAAGPAPLVETQDMSALMVGPDAVLVTYRAVRADRVTLRSSLWMRDRAGWRLLFHQGTLQG